MEPSAGTTPTRERSRTFSEAEADSHRLSTAPHAGEITPNELRAEMESLLSLRRRSLSHPTSLDPDLPIPTRPTLHIHTATPPLSPPTEHSHSPKSPTAPTAAETGTLTRRISSSVPPTRLPSDHPLPVPLVPLASPPLSSQYSPPHDGAAAAHSSQDLFWLPASLHPELAPQEFKAFIREQTRPDNLARRVSSAGGEASGFGSGRIDRKRSTLRGEYIPGRGDGVGERDPALAERRPSTGGRRSANGLNFDELTIKDLQRLESLAARAESENFTDGEGEGERLGRVLRRSLSLNPTHLAAAAVEGAHRPSPDTPTDSTDSPLVVHIPGQILRRSARTKIRKAGLVGDGGGHRFGPSRRGRPSMPPASDEFGAESDSAGEMSFDGVDLVSLDGHGSPFLDEPVDKSADLVSRRSSASDDSQDFSASVEHIEIAPDSLLVVPQSVPLPPSPISPLTLPVVDYPPPPAVDAQPDPSSADFDWSTQQDRLVQIQSTAPVARPTLSRASAMPPAPEFNAYRQSLAPSVVPIQLPQAPTRDLKEKKSGWARLGLSSKSVEDDDGKRKKGKGKETEKMVEPPRRASSQSHEPVERKASGEKESSFFGGLFGKRRSDIESHASSPSPPPSAALHLAPPPPPPTASGVMGPHGRYTNFYRLPIHVERAVYRLSHIKLANSRRPLYEQVLISNLMFWYLSIINKPTPPPVVNVVAPEENNGFQRDSGVREGAMREGGAKRPGLKSAGRPGRSAEQPIKQIKYDDQTRQIDQEYPPLPLTNHQSSTPSSSSSSSHSESSSQPQHSRSVSSPTTVSSHSNQPRHSPDRYSAPADYSRDENHSPPPSPSKMTGSRSTGSLSDATRDEYSNQRDAPTKQRSTSSSASYRENQGFQVTSRNQGSRRSDEYTQQANDSSNGVEAGGYEKRPLSVRRSGDGFDDFIDHYTGRYSPPPSNVRYDEEERS